MWWILRIIWHIFTDWLDIYISIFFLHQKGQLILLINLLFFLHFILHYLFKIFLPRRGVMLQNRVFHINGSAICPSMKLFFLIYIEFLSYVQGKFCSDTDQGICNPLYWGRSGVWILDWAGLSYFSINAPLSLPTLLYNGRLQR